MTKIQGSTPSNIPVDRIEAVLFDLDDTLVDTRSNWREAFSRVMLDAYSKYPNLRSLGTGEHIHDKIFQPLVRQEQQRDGGEWNREFLRRAFHVLLSKYANHDVQFANHLFQSYLDEQPGEVDLFPNVLPILDALCKTHRLALVSNGLGPQQRSKIGPLGLEPYFTVIAISGELGLRKPDPEIFRHVLTRLNVTANTAVHVGDDLYADVGGAIASGINAIWINRDGEPPEEGPSPNMVISTMSELGSIFGLE